MPGVHEQAIAMACMNKGQQACIDGPQSEQNVDRSHLQSSPPELHAHPHMRHTYVVHTPVLIKYSHQPHPNPRHPNLRHPGIHGCDQRPAPGNQYVRKHSSYSAGRLSTCAQTTTTQQRASPLTPHSRTLAPSCRCNFHPSHELSDTVQCQVGR